MQFFRLLCIDDYIMLLFEFLFCEIMLSQLNRDIYFLHKIKTEKSEKKYLHLSFKYSSVFCPKKKTVGNIWIHMFQASFFFTKNLRLQTDEHIMPLFNNVLFVTIQILLNNIQKLKHRQPNLKNLKLKLCIRNKQITI